MKGEKKKQCDVNGAETAFEMPLSRIIQKI